MSQFGRFVGGLVVMAALAMGCSSSNEPAAQTKSASAPEAAYLLTEKPADSVGVAEAKANPGDAEELTVIGRIGGMEKPFVDSIAAFRIVDPSVPHCQSDEGCPTPWDYCCVPADKLKESTAMVKVVDAGGKPVARDARALLGVKELSMVVVRGKAQRDEEGNLTLLTQKVHVVQD